MRFPEESRLGTHAHTSALDQLEAAQAEQREKTEALDASEATGDEKAAEAELSVANDELAAREPWVSWVERGY